MQAALKAWQPGASADSCALGQDAPRDAAPAHLACLASTAQVLAALRRACAARHSILADACPAATVETVQLPEVTTAVPLGLKRYWDLTCCRQIAFSTCGGWLAIVLRGLQSFRPAEGQSDPCTWPSSDTHEVLLYSISSEMQIRQQARFSRATSCPKVQWHSAAPLLSVATVDLPSRAGDPSHRLPGRSGTAQPGFGAFVVDARTGSKEHALTPDVARPVSAALAREDLSLIWSPCSTFLLVQRQQWDTGLGHLSVLDVTRDQAVVGSRHMLPLEEAQHRPLATWYPGCALGIVLPGGMELQEPEAFSLAGVAVGSLPKPFPPDAEDSFSPDAKYVIASGKGLSGRAAPLALFSCSLVGTQIHFQLEHNFGLGFFEAHWVPGGSSLLVRERPSPVSGAFYDKVVALPIGSQPDRFVVQTEEKQFSPSGRFLAGQGPGGLLLADLETSKPVWDAARRDPGWPELTKLERILALRGEPLGVNTGHKMRCHGWSPQGTSLVCTIQGVEAMRAPPHLRMYWFA